MRAFFSNLIPKRWRKAEKRSFWPAWATVSGATRSKKNINAVSIESIPAFYRAVTILSQTLASLPFCVYRKTEEGIEEHTAHPVYDLLKFSPSPRYNSFTFVESLVRSLMIYHRAFAYPLYDSNFRLREIIFIPEDEIQVLEFRHPAISEKEIAYRISGLDRPVFEEDIIHVRISSWDGVNTRSVSQIFSETLGRAICEIDYGAGYYGNGANLSGTLQSEQTLKPEIKDQIIDQWQRVYTGENAIGKVAILDGGLEYKPLGTTPVDADYINSRKMSVEDISNITGVPVFLLANNDRSTFNNIEHLDRTFANYTVGPIARAIEAEFNAKLFGERERKRVYTNFDLSQLYRGDRETMAKWYTTMFQVGAMSPNDIRRNENLNPYPGGDEYFAQLNMAPVDEIEAIHTDPGQPAPPANDPEPEPRKLKLNGTRKKDIQHTY